MKYIVTIVGDYRQELSYESNSRNSVKHLRDNQGEKCFVTDRNGNIVSAAQRFVDKIYHVTF